MNVVVNVALIVVSVVVFVVKIKKSNGIMYINAYAIFVFFVRRKLLLYDIFVSSLIKCNFI